MYVTRIFLGKKQGFCTQKNEHLLSGFSKSFENKLASHGIMWAHAYRFLALEIKMRKLFIILNESILAEEQSWYSGMQFTTMFDYSPTALLRQRPKCAENSWVLGFKYLFNICTNSGLGDILEVGNVQGQVYCIRATKVTAGAKLWLLEPLCHHVWPQCHASAKGAKMCKQSLSLT